MKTYKELLHEICTTTDWSNKEQAIETAQVLVTNALEYHRLCLAQEKIIKKYLTAEQWEKESRAVAKSMYEGWVDRLPDGEFKEFMLENMDLVTGDKENTADDEE